MATIAECPTFYYSKFLIEKIGVKGLLTLAHMLYAVRVFTYAVIPRGNGIFGYWLFLATEPLHAFIFASMWSASVEHSRRHTPPQYIGVMQVCPINYLYP